MKLKKGEKKMNGKNNFPHSKFILKPEIENLKTCYTDKDLIALLNAIRSGDKKEIELSIKKATENGATYKDIWQVLSEVVGDERLLNSILETLKLIAK